MSQGNLQRASSAIGGLIVCFAIEKYSHATGQNGTTFPWEYVQSRDLHLVMDRFPPVSSMRGISSIRLRVVQGTNDLDVIPIEELIQQATMMKQKIESVGGQVITDRLPISGVSRDFLLAIRYERPNRESRRVQFRLQTPADVQEMVRLLRSMGMALQLQPSKLNELQQPNMRPPIVQPPSTSQVSNGPPAQWAGRPDTAGTQHANMTSRFQSSAYQGLVESSNAVISSDAALMPPPSRSSATAEGFYSSEQPCSLPHEGSMDRPTTAFSANSGQRIPAVWPREPHVSNLDEIIPRRELPFQRPDDVPVRARSSRPTSSANGLPPLREPKAVHEPRNSLADLNKQVPTSSRFSHARITSPKSVLRLEPPSDPNYIFEARDLHGNPVGQGKENTPMTNTWSSLAQQWSGAYAGANDNALPTMSPSSPRSGSSKPLAPRSANVPSRISSGADAEHEIVDKHGGFMSNPDTRPRPEDRATLADYAAQTPDERLGQLNDFFCENVMDENFTKLCEDVEQCWRRIALGVGVPNP